MGHSADPAWQHIKFGQVFKGKQVLNEETNEQFVKFSRKLIIYLNYKNNCRHILIFA